MTSSDLLDLFREWLSEQKGRLDAVGLESEMHYSRVSASTRSLFFHIESESRIGRITVWESGLADISQATVGESDAKSRSLTFQKLEDLRSEANRLIDWVVGGN